MEFPDGSCPVCKPAAAAAPGAGPRVTKAELAARRTAAAAVRTDFERASYEYAMQGAPVPDWATWAQRLSIALAGLLDIAEGAETGDDSDDGLQPYCTTCLSWVGMFHGMTGWHHFRGDPAPGSQRVLYEAGHPAAIGWIAPPGGALSPGDVRDALGALDHAGQLMRERAAGGCEGCVTAPAGACDVCLDELDQTDAYAALAARLGGQGFSGPVLLGDVIDGLRAEVADAIDVALSCSRAARQLGAIRAVLARVLDSEHGDRQMALEEIDRIAAGGEGR
jgi:hypothetical protein